MSTSIPLIASSMNESSIAHYYIKHDDNFLDELKAKMFESNLNSYLITLIEQSEEHKGNKKVVGSVYLVSSFDVKNKDDLDELSKVIEGLIFSSDLQRIEFDRNNYSYIISKVNLALEDGQDPFLTENEFLQLSRNNFTKYDRSSLPS